MKEISLALTLLSNTIIGSGDGYGAIIDTDVVFDEYGIPYIPSRRIKGVLRDSANQICHYLNLNKDKSANEYPIVEEIFGTGFKESLFAVSNLYLSDYENLRDWLRYLTINNPDIYSRESIISNFTSIRQQTAIENGVAKRNSLRTIRCLDKGLTFYGKIELSSEREEILELLYLSAINLKHLGTKRNRGFGEVKCELNIDYKNILQKLEAKCLKLDTL